MTFYQFSNKIFPNLASSSPKFYIEWDPIRLQGYIKKEKTLNPNNINYNDNNNYDRKSKNYGKEENKVLLGNLLFLDLQNYFRLSKMLI